MNRARLLDWTVLVGLVIVWGSAFAALKTAVGALPPAWVVTSRLWIGAVTLLAVMIWLRERAPKLTPRPDRLWLWYAGVGVLGTALPFALFAFASTRLPSAVVAICSGATPVFTAILAHLFVSSDRLTARRSLGVGLGFIGIILLVGPGVLTLLGANAVASQGVAVALVAGLLGGIGYAAGSILTRQAPPISATTGAFVFCFTGALAATPLALLQAGPPTWPGAAAATSILFLGVGPTGLASAAWVWLVHRRGPVFGSFPTYLAPVWATLVGVLLLGERPGWTAYAALALILAGVAVASRPSRAVRAAAGSR
jgi:drug/metabolite transporter (DMT)-like permease